MGGSSPMDIYNVCTYFLYERHTGERIRSISISLTNLIHEGEEQISLFDNIIQREKEMIQEQTKIPRPILTQDAKERIENKLLISYLGEEEILLTYYKNGYLYKNYITVADINPLNKTITCTDAFHNQRMFKFGDVVEVN